MENQQETKKTIWYLPVIIIVALALIIFGLFMWQGKKATSETVKIGFMSALSGNYASMGNDILRGVQDGIKKYDPKKNLGRDVELLVEDNQANPQIAVTAYQSLKQKGAKVFFASFSGIVGALNPLSKEDKIILMYNAVPSNYAEENEYAFKIYADAVQESDFIIKSIKEKGNDSTTGIAYVNNPSTQIMHKEFADKLGNIPSYSFDVKETDFKTIILKLKNEKIKNVILLGYPAQLLSFLKQSSELEFTPQNFFVNSDGVVAEVIDFAGEYLSKMKTNYFTVGYGENPREIYYIFGHDLSAVLMQGMKRCRDLEKELDDAECLKSELLKVEVKGMSGDVEITSSRKSLLSPSLYILKDKELKLVQP